LRFPPKPRESPDFGTREAEALASDFNIDVKSAEKAAPVSSIVDKAVADNSFIFITVSLCERIN
jgi:hypothetical protein